MQAGELIASDVMAYSSRVLVDGVARPVTSWSVSRELSGDLPAQVVSGSGITQATGTIEWASEFDVQGGARNPWNASNGWIPTKGARVEIFAGDGMTEWKQFTGVIDNVSGSIGGGFSSSIIDDYDKLSARVSHKALLRLMPPSTLGGTYRRTGLVSTYYVDLALRKSGFFITPAQEPNAVLFAPCQGGMWPHSGGVVDADLYDIAEEIHNPNRAAPWGFAVSDFRNTYSPRYTEAATVPVQLTVMVAPDHAGTFTLQVFYGSNEIRLAVGNDRRAVAYSSTGTLTEACRLTPAQMSGATVVTMLFKNGAVTLGNNKGVTVTGSSPAMSGTTGNIVTIGDANVRIAGIQVNHPTEAYLEMRPLTHVQSAVMDMSNVTLLGTLNAAPDIDGVESVDLLSEISQSNLSAMWIDEKGVFQWVPSTAFNDRAVDQFITTADDILELSWEDSLLGSRSLVTVKYKADAIKLSRWNTVEAYVGSGVSLDSGEIIEEFIGPETDEAWIDVDESISAVGFPNWADYNNRSGSVSGFTYTNGEMEQSGTGLATTTAMVKLGLSRYKITYTADIYPPGTIATAETSTANVDLWAQNRGKPLPRIRAGAVAAWSETEIVGIGAGGIGPELVHDAGYWVVPEIAQRIADYLVGQTAVPRPTVHGLKVTYDPRRQLGDKITISSPNLMGVVLQALVTGVNNSAGSGGFEQSLTVVITSASSTFQTYEEFNRAGGTLTYQQWQALGPLPETYTQFNSSQEA